MADIRGEVALVFGGAGGIGSAVCRLLGENGVKVVCADITTLNLPTGVWPQYLNCDVTSNADVESVFLRCIDGCGKSASIVVNCAGIIHETHWEHCVDVNLNGTIRVTLAAQRHLSRTSGHNGGVVINVASILGLSPGANVPVYTATKHAVVGLTRSWALSEHFSLHGVRYNAVCPTAVDTDMLQQAVEGRMYFHQQLAAAAPNLPKLTPEQVATSIVNLVRDPDANGDVIIVSAADGVQKVDFEDYPAL